MSVNRGDRPITRYSTGIALCKRDSDGIVRLLMISRRITYAFHAFVSGQYNDRSDARIIELFNKMTLDEKLDVLSLNFSQLWYRLWLGQSMNGNYTNVRNKFNDKMVGDNGERLRNLMRKSTTSAKRIWEIPKGHKKYSGECDMDCAIREFYEETGIPRSAYRITNGNYVISFTEEGITYHITYFIALANRDIVFRLGASALVQVSEVCDISWVSAAEMEAYAPRDIPGHKRVISYVRKLLKNRDGRKSS